MAASAALEGAKGAGECEQAVNDHLDVASKMLQQYKQATQAITDRHQSLGSAPTRTEDKSQVYMLLMVMTPLMRLHICIALLSTLNSTVSANKNAHKSTYGYT